ncbi:MAG: hypothetical protein JWN46_3875 [Acidimicrobiales bacterium]|nr:hypothetical protein [Acidimicrobiales bacterium]
MPRYRFALRPRWILSHVFVLVLVVAMINLGFWQLRRLDEKKQRNRRYRERTAQPVAPLSALLRAAGSSGSGGGVGSLEYRRVLLRGTYRADQEVLVRGRSQDSAPGSWVLTPLTQPDGTTAIVNRGWIANSGGVESVPAAYRAPSGTVTVAGLLRPSEVRGSFGSIDPPTGRLTNLARVDVARIQRQVPERLFPAWVQLESPRSAASTPSGVPRPLDPPALDEGPHLSYAIQWFLFSTGALVFYPLILRRRAREIEAEQAAGPLDGPDPDDVPEPGDPRLQAVDGGSPPPLG